MDISNRQVRMRFEWNMKTVMSSVMTIVFVVAQLVSPNVANAQASAWNLDLYDLTLYPTQTLPIRLYNLNSQFLGNLGAESKLTIRVDGDLVRAALVNGQPDMRQILRSAAYRDVNGNYSLQLVSNGSLVTQEGRQLPAGTEFLVAVNDFLALTQQETQESYEVVQPTGSGADIDGELEDEDDDAEEFHETRLQQFDTEMTRLRGRPFPQGILSPPVCDCGPACRISSFYGARASRRTTNGNRMSRFHKGMDVAGPEGTPVVAAADGCVSRLADNNDRGNTGYGNSVYLAHGNGYETQYSHLKRVLPGIRAGQCFKRGDTIGYMGHTGNVASRRGGLGTHLHFSLLQDGNRVDPWARFVSTAKSERAMRVRCNAQMSFPTTDSAMRNALGLGDSSPRASTARQSTASR